MKLYQLLEPILSNKDEINKLEEFIGKRDTNLLGCYYYLAKDYSSSHKESDKFLLGVEWRSKEGTNTHCTLVTLPNNYKSLMDTENSEVELVLTEESVMEWFLMEVLEYNITTIGIHNFLKTLIETIKIYGNSIIEIEKNHSKNHNKFCEIIKSISKNKGNPLLFESNESYKEQIKVLKLLAFAAAIVN